MQAGEVPGKKAMTTFIARQLALSLVYNDDTGNTISNNIWNGKASND